MTDMANTYDWETIEKDYRTGRFSLQKLSERHGPSKGTISKRAAREGWTKDLTGAVQQRTREKLSRPESDAPDIPEAELVEQAASENATIVRGHRDMLAKWRDIQERFTRQMMEQLDRGTRAVMDRSGHKVEIDIDLEYVGKCMGHGTQSLERVVKMERQSYGMDVEGEENDEPERALTDDELAHRIAELESKRAAGGL